MAEPTKVNPQITDFVAPETAEKAADVAHQPAEDQKEPTENAGETSEG